MANGKIISFVDNQINAALEPLRKETTCAVAVAYHDIDQLTDRVRETRLSLTNAIADNTLTLRRDINALAATINTLRADIDQIKIINDRMRFLGECLDASNQNINRMAGVIFNLEKAVESLKQGGDTPEAK